MTDGIARAGGRTIVAMNLRRLLPLAALALVLGPAAGAASARPDSGTAWVGATHTDNGILIVAGDVKDAVLGTGALVYRVKVRPAGETGVFTVTSKSVTLYTPKGTLKGAGSATQTIAADGTTTVSNGHILLNKGTGKLRGHTLRATFSGPLKDGVYTFTYKGTYK